MLEDEVEEASQWGWFFCDPRQSGAETRRGVRQRPGTKRKRSIGGSWSSWGATSGNERAEQRERSAALRTS